MDSTIVVSYAGGMAGIRLSCPEGDPGDNPAIDACKPVLYRCGTGEAVRNATADEAKAWKAQSVGHIELSDGYKYQVIE
jgi:hypothetical protein